MFLVPRNLDTFSLLRTHDRKVRYNGLVATWDLLSEFVTVYTTKVNEKLFFVPQNLDMMNFRFHSTKINKKLSFVRQNVDMINFRLYSTKARHTLCFVPWKLDTVCFLRLTVRNPSAMEL